MLPPGQPTTGSWMRRNLLRLSLEKAGVMLVSREKELEEWAKTVTDASIERECRSPAKFTASAGCTASNKISPSRTRGFCIIFMEFFPLAFWPNTFPTAGAPLALLWASAVPYLCHISPCEADDHLVFTRICRAGYALRGNIQGSAVWGLHLGHCLDKVSELIASHEEPALSSSSARHKGSLQHPLCLQEFTFCSHYLCLFLRFSLPWCTIHFIAPWIFPCISCLCSLWV